VSRSGATTILSVFYQPDVPADAEYDGDGYVRNGKRYEPTKFTVVGIET